MMKPNSLEEPLKRARRRLELQAQKAAHAAAKEAAATANSRALLPNNGNPACLTEYLCLEGKKTTLNASEPRDPHPLHLTAKPSLSTRIPRTKTRKPPKRRPPTRYAVPQHETTEPKKFANEKQRSSASKNEQTRLVGEKPAPNGDGAKVSPPPLQYQVSDQAEPQPPDSDPSEEPLSRTTSNKDPPRPSPAPPKPSHKKTGRPPARRGRIGRNQYTKDRDPPPTADPPTSPVPSNANGADEVPPPVNGTSSHHNPNIKNGNPKDTEKPRPKHLNPNRTTMNDMKRRVAAILEFISHTQVEMAAHSDTQSSNPTPPDSGASSNGKEAEGSGGVMLQKLLEGQRILDEIGGEGFATLSSVEMMEVLTRRLMRWQGEYGKWGEK